MSDVGLTWDELKEVLKKRVAEEGGKGPFAKRIGLSPGFFGDIMNDRRQPSNYFLALVGFEKVITYRPVRPVGDEGISDGEGANV